ncbi:hypothetical protein E3T46_00990 [Cryobacterium sp. Hh11]|uniref:phosphotransferase n=1 Tax=Cryobacterium sp. Hh11 TaxID=2555868 RepID=UPI001069B1BB|nr:phosphotransferase [Cryobacterium sp. Hh11]TFD54265.1 hypothetical protein E3T46_00990 [Cryobacterium sp. Hh11]
MADYSILEHSDISELEVDFGWAVQSVQALPGGAANSSFRLDIVDNKQSRQIVVVTIMDNHSPTTALRLANVTRLVSGAVRTPPLLSARNGDNIVSVGAKLICVKPFVSGRHVEHLSDLQLGAVGAALGLIHLVATPSWVPEFGRRIPTKWQDLLGASAPTRLQSLLQRAAGIVEASQNLPVGLVHGDLFLDNLLWDESGDVTVLDWETASRDILVIDLGVTVVAMCRTDGALDRQKLELLLGGYDESRTLSTEERSAVVPFAFYAAVLLGYHRYVRHNVRFPCPAKSRLWEDLADFAEVQLHTKELETFESRH